LNKVIATRSNAKDAIAQVGASPVRAQLIFLKELAADKKEADAFIRDPKKYSVDHGILLDPNIVALVTQHILVEPIPVAILEAQLGKRAAADILTLRAPGNIAAFPAAAAAIAAVVMAAVAVVTMVVTLVRVQRPQDLVALRGIGPKGILMPSGQQFRQQFRK
jgi:hypothetical protein